MLLATRTATAFGLSGRIQPTHACFGTVGNPLRATQRVVQCRGRPLGALLRLQGRRGGGCLAPLFFHEFRQFRQGAVGIFTATHSNVVANVVANVVCVFGFVGLAIVHSQMQ